VIEMGISIDLHRYSFDELVSKLMEKEGINDKEMLEKILTFFGLRIGDVYLLLNNELSGAYNSYYSAPDFINRYFGVEKSFDIFLDLWDVVNMSNDIDCAELELKIELPMEDR